MLMYDREAQKQNTDSQPCHYSEARQPQGISPLFRRIILWYNLKYRVVRKTLVQVRFLPDKDRLQRITHEEPIMMILLFGVLNDEQRALVERIFHEHRVHFQRISFKIVKSEEAAEDVVSTAFVKIMDNIEKISELPCPQMTAFCVTIVKNASIDVLRHSQQSVHLDRWDCVSDENSDDLADECIHNADVRKLTELIDRLDPDDRRFVYLRYAEEMGYKEIGELLNISEDAAKKRGQRLVKKLRKLYEGR